MNQKEIVMTFNEDGSVEMEGKGFIGTECDKAMKDYEQALGKQTKRTNKPEYVRQAVNQQTRVKA